MATQLTPEQLKAKFTGTSKRLSWQDAVDLYNKLRVHADGDTPIWLIKDARPNESDQVREYREKIYEPETQNPVERVIGVLEKIRRSPDWMINFPTEVPAIIAKGETLEEYIDENYPVYGSLEAWLFEEALRNVGLDANALIVVMPKTLQVTKNEYLQPIAQIYNSQNVIDFVAEDYAIVKSDDLSSLLTPEQQQQRLNSVRSVSDYNKTKTESFTSGQVYYVITTAWYQKWEETAEAKYQLTQQLPHNLNALPAWQMPGKFLRRIGTNVLKKTLLNPMVPHLNKAARESNDLDAGVIMHLYLEKWRINNTPCTNCNGAGKVANPTGGPTTCKTCAGTGLASGKSPFNEIQIKAAALGQANIPVPPVGYVVKDPEILKLQNDRIKEHIYKSYEAVNMEHLADTQLNQSGVAKAYDGDEVNTMIYAFADSLVNIASTAVYWINELRYKSIVPNEEQRYAMLPVIPVPEKFDVINTSMLLSEYQIAKTAGLNSIILAEMQKEISQKKFYANPDVADYVHTIMDLDPFPDKTIDEKSMMEAGNLATQLDIVTSIYISDFVNRAVEEDKNFNSKTNTQKREVIKKYAEEKVAALSTSKQISQDIMGDQNNPANEQQQTPGDPDNPQNDPLNQSAAA